MRRLILILLLFAVSIAEAQTDSTNNGWEIVERCVGEPTAPPDDWSFEGYFAFYNEDGIHAIRHELATPYYIAFSRPDQFIQYASFSLDGRWLSIPSGFTERKNWVGQYYNVTEYRIFNTGLNRELVHRIPRDYVFDHSGQFLENNIWEWQGNDYFDFQIGPSWNIEGYQRILISDDVYEIRDIEEMEHISPEDYSRELAIIADTLIIRGNFTPSPNGQYLAFEASLRGAEQLNDSIYILDLDTQAIFDICVSVDTTRLSLAAFWSPDSTQIILGNMFQHMLQDFDYIRLIDLEENAQYLLDYQFYGYILNWYP